MHWDAPLQFRSGVSCASIGSNGERARSGPWGRHGVGGRLNGGERAVSQFDDYVVPWLYGNVLEAVRLVGSGVEGL